MGKVTFEFDENKEDHDIELVVNRYNMCFVWCGRLYTNSNRNKIINGVSEVF